MEQVLLDEQPGCLNEAIDLGLRMGADYVLECLEVNGENDYVFVMPGECIGTIEKACWRASFSVNTIDLNELRQQGAFAC